MNSRDALRLADPARQLPPHHLNSSDEALLQQILATDAPPRVVTNAAQPSRPRSRRDWQVALITGVVAVAVAAGTFAAISTTSSSAPAPAHSSSPRSLEAAVQARLVEAADGRAIDPDQPSQFWTQEQPGSQGDMIGLTGKTLYLAAACEGGGTVTIQFSNEPDTVLDCTTQTTIGPINLTELLSRQKNGVSIDVAATAGRPRYLVKELASPTPTLKTNARGQTYGPDTGEQHPDLIAAIATNGRTGYISADELRAIDPCRSPANPAAAVKCDQEYLGEALTLSVYESDGVTVIGRYNFGG